MKRSILDFEEAVKVLKPYKERLVDSISAGFDDYLALIKCASDHIGLVDFEIRTKASIIHDLMRRRIKDEFTEVGGIRAGEWNRIFGLIIEDKIFIRLKKIDKRFRSSNYPTEQTKSYLHQSTFPGFPDRPTLLFVGYMPDEAMTMIEGIYLTCWSGENLLWQVNLKSDDTYNQPLLIVDPSTLPAKPVVSVRKKDKKSKLSVVK